MALYLPDGLRRSVALADYTTWKVGGPATYFAEPESTEELLALLHWAKGIGCSQRVIGAGSNLLISDQGLEGLTLCTRHIQGAELETSSGLVEAQAGEPIPTLARRAARAGLSGLEWAVGIPGTVGGAAVMNAGAQGGCTAEILESVTVVNPQEPSQTHTIPGAALDFAYRHSRLQEEPLVVLSARLRLSPGHDPKTVSQRTSANLHSRTSSQPYQQPSCGSVFRNPEPQKAGQLIEALGLKGLSIGGAQVSPIHANFIVNIGAASAGDIDRLIAQVQERVMEHHSIALHTEVKRLGPFEDIALAA
ncbi:UDP-N-acetylmuramate dehydrogenase [Synechococcus sp. W4D4]|uniref:UDP-N-acetylmuramate dehydrogenase n=1 Tax=Synechococcus sp. W4D4 TaxID=3392294 RepID=UPI0039ED3E25